ncbi:MAG: hypothetical protein LBO65_00590 [Spirochaetaceae bacterium]|jgi:predicted dehydrogenase|nr:hypothetical protein [Spirochaetaceae bacterium]
MDKLRLEVPETPLHHSLRAAVPLRGSLMVETCGIAPRNPGKAQKYTKKWGVKRACGSSGALLADPKAGFAYCPLPNALHLIRY